MPTIGLRLDVLSDFAQTACVFEKSSVLGKNPLFKSYTIWYGSISPSSGGSPNDYLNVVKENPERSKVSFIHVFRGCGVSVEFFDRRTVPSGAIYEVGSNSDQLDKTYVPIIVKVLDSLFDSRSLLALDIRRAAMDKNHAGKMREELFAPFYHHAHGSKDNLAAILEEKLKGLSSKGSGINPVTSPESYDSSVTIQRERSSRLASHGLYDGGLIGLELQGGAGMHQSTNQMTSPEFYHSSATIQRDGGSGMASMGQFDATFMSEYSPEYDVLEDILRRVVGSLELQGGAGMLQSTNQMTNHEFYHSSAAVQRVGGSGLASQGLPHGALKDQVLEEAEIRNIYPMRRSVPLETARKVMVSQSDGLYDGGLVGLALQEGAGTHLITNPMTNPELYHSSAATIQRDRHLGLASQRLSDGAIEAQVSQGSNIHKTHLMTCSNSLATVGRAIYSSLASLGVSDDALKDLESQGADIPVVERMYYMLSEHNQSVQQWLRDAGTVGASFSAVYASPSLITQLPAAVAFISILTAMWLPRKCRRTKNILTKIGAIACIASVMSAMIKHLSPVGMAIAGAVFLIPAGVVVLG